MKVRCINNIGNWEDSVRLTVGKIYNVEEIRTDGYLIKNDDEILACYYTYRFEEVEEVEKEKVLEVEFQEVFDKVAWRITYQNEDVLSRDFEDREIGVKNVGAPFFDYNGLCLKGRNEQGDDRILLVDKEEAEIIKQRVDTINEKYGIPKRWRAGYNGKYFVIGNDGVIFEDRDKGFDADNRRYVLGNYFKTKEEAQAKLEKIKQILQGE